MGGWGPLVTGWRGIYCSFISFSIVFFLFVWAERADFTYYTPHELHLSFLIITLVHPSSAHLVRIVLFTWQYCGAALVLSLLQAAVLGYFFVSFGKVNFRKKKKRVVSYLEAGRQACVRQEGEMLARINWEGCRRRWRRGYLKMLDFNHILRFA